MKRRGLLGLGAALLLALASCAPQLVTSKPSVNTAPQNVEVKLVTSDPPQIEVRIGNNDALLKNIEIRGYKLKVGDTRCNIVGDHLECPFNVLIPSNKKFVLQVSGLLIRGYATVSIDGQETTLEFQ